MPLTTQNYREHLIRAEKRARKHPGKPARIAAGWYLLFDGKDLIEIYHFEEGPCKGEWGGAEFVNCKFYLDPRATLGELVASIRPQN